MLFRSTIMTLASCVVFAGAAEAGSVTIDFNAPNVVFAGGTYAEDGFIVDGTETSNGQILNQALVEGLFTFSQTVEESFSFTKADGGLFSFLSFDYAAVDSGALADEFKLIGYAGGLFVADYGTYAATSSTFLTQAIVNGILIDKLVIFASNPNNSPPSWDNFVFDTVETEVPLPAALPLFLASLVGLGAMRRRRTGA